MPRVVCQVLARNDRITFIWSDGDASFPPYSIEGLALLELRRHAEQAHAHLARLGSSGDDAALSASIGVSLAQAGLALHRLIFQLNVTEPAPGQEVRAWFDCLTRDGAVEQIEIIGDAFALPWTAVCDHAPAAEAFAESNGDGWKCFWGRRFTLLGGRRVQWLRGRNLPENPSVVFLLDSVARAGLPSEEQKLLTEYLASHDIPVAESCARLAAIFQAREVDLLYVFGRADGDAIRIGDGRVTADALETLVFGLGDDEGPSGQTVIVLNACPGGPSDNLLSAFERFGTFGLIGTSQPLAAPIANRCGIELLIDLVDGGQTLAQSLTELRRRRPIAGSIYFASCPGNTRASTKAETELDSEPTPLPNDPYQPLAPLYEESASLLVGREYDAFHVAALLDENPTRMVLIHGGIGIGKTSLLHAGIVPYLEQRSIGYRFLRQRAEGEPSEDETQYLVLVIRATSDLAGQLSMALLDFCSAPFSYVTPTGTTITVDLPTILANAVPGAETLPSTEELRVSLRRRPENLGRILADITATLPFELVLAIDDAEEVFSLGETPRSERGARRGAALLRAALNAPARAKLIVLTRTEYAGRLVELLAAPDSNRVLRTFQVGGLSEEDLTQVVLQPTSQEPILECDEAPHTQYRFQFEQGLAEHIAAEAVRLGRANQEAPAALVQVVCARLYDLVRARPHDPIVRVADLKAIGGIDKALSKYVDLEVRRVGGGDRQALGALMSRLVTRNAAGAATIRPIFEEDLKADWAGAQDLPDIVSATAEARLLTVDYLNIGGREGNYVSLGGDSLAPVVAQRGAEAETRSRGWSKFRDALWITVPLLVLLGVFSVTRIYSLSKAKAALETERDMLAERFSETASELQAKNWPAYRGQLALAESAILSGDMIGARQALLAVKPSSERDGDYRGFDWHYLWRQLHPEHATLYGHRDTVASLAISDDGLTLASTSADGSVRVWDIRAGRELAKFDLRNKSTNASSPGRCVALSPDSSLLAAAAEDGVIRLAKVQRGGFGSASNVATFIGSLIPHEIGAVFPMVQVATRGLATESVTVYAELVEHKGAVLALAFAPDVKLLASAGEDDAIRLWDLAERQPVATQNLKGHVGKVRALAYSPDGKWLANGGADTKIQIWNATKFAKEATLEMEGTSISALAWSPDGKTLAAAGAASTPTLESGIVRYWDSETWKEHPISSLPVAPVFDIAYANNGKTLITASKSNLIQMWDPVSGQEQATLRGHLGWIASVVATRDGAVVASGSYDGSVKVWMPHEALKRDLFKVSTSAVGGLAFSPDDRWLATGSDDGTLRIWEVATCREHKLLDSQKGAVLALGWSPTGKLLATGGVDGKLRLFDADPLSKTIGQAVETREAHAKGITCLQWRDDDSQLVTGSLDGSAKLWTLRDGKIMESALDIATESPVLCLTAYDGDKLHVLATGHADGTARLWNPGTGKELGVSRTTYNAHHGGVTGIGFLYFEQRKLGRLITAGLDQTVKYWNVGSGEVEFTHRGHSGAINCAALGPWPELSLVTGGADQNLLLWDPEIFQQRGTFTPGVGVVRAVAVSHAGRTIAAAGQNGQLRLLRAAKKEPKDK